MSSKLNNMLSFKISTLKESLKKQKEIEELEKKLKNDKKQNHLKIKKMMDEKTKKENYLVGSELRKLFEKDDVSIEAVKEICTKNFISLDINHTSTQSVKVKTNA